jgi:HEAT repeat protein
LLVGAPDRARLITHAKSTILDQELVTELAAQGSHSEGGALLSLFGDSAIEALLQRIAEEQVGARRSTLIGVVSGLVPDHQETLSRWVRDDRWFVVRNVMTIVQRSGSPSDMLKLIDVGIRHPHPTVRREAIKALGAAGADALPRLVVLAVDPDSDVAAAAVDALSSVALIAAEGEAAAIGEVVRTAHDAEVRRKALLILARHPSDEAVEVLQKISRFGPKPRAPLSVRRQAKAFARQRSRA